MELNILRKCIDQVVLLHIEWNDKTTSNFSGFLSIIDKKKKIITARHCLEKKDSEITTIFDMSNPDNPEKLTWNNIAISNSSDIATIDIETDRDIWAGMKLDSKHARIGSDIYVIGFPQALRGNKLRGSFYSSPIVRKGIISACVDSDFWADIIVSPGDSGGMVITWDNNEAKCIGVTSYSRHYMKSGEQLQVNMGLCGISNIKWISGNGT